MNFAAGILPGWLVVALSAIQALAVALCLWRAPWRQLTAVASRQHLLMASVLCLAVLWWMHAAVNAGVSFHLLAMTSVTLLLGVPLAIIAGTAAQLLGIVAGQFEPQLLGVQCLVDVTVPALFTALWLRALYRFGPRNLFTYLIGVGFFGGALAMLINCLVALGLLALGGRDELVADLLEQAPLIVLLMFPEGFINGTVVTAVTVFLPDWVKTFDDDYFLGD